jgi:hypothetical protein
LPVRASSKAQVREEIPDPIITTSQDDEDGKAAPGLKQQLREINGKFVLTVVIINVLWEKPR